MQIVAGHSTPLGEGDRFTWKNSEDKHQKLVLICMYYLDLSQLFEIFSHTNSFVPAVFSLL